MEPSSLSTVCGVIILYYIYSVLTNNMKYKIWHTICGILMMLILYFSAGLTGIISLTLSTVILLLIKMFNLHKNNKLKEKENILIISIIIIIGAILLLNNSIRYRIIDVLSMKDASFYYRFNLSMKSLASIIIYTHGVGVGFGNLNTEKSLAFLNDIGMPGIFANSYPYFIAEGGVAALILIIGLNLYIIKGAVKSNCSEFQVPLAIYTIIIQLASGYFTDPFLWILLGIASSEDFNPQIYGSGVKSHPLTKMIQ
jgi:hypothetical protein